MKNILIFTILINMYSCASYVQSVHKQIDNEHRRKYTRIHQTQQMRGGIKNPVTLSGDPTANTSDNMYPKTKRQYYQQGKKRFRANDLVDNSSDGSLWSGKNSESYLFVNNSSKRRGDIVIVEVFKSLKEQIQGELKRTFPEKKSITKSPAKKDETKDAQEAPTNPNQPENTNKVYDKISTSVVEQINQDYLLIRGRKEVLYQKYKRYFEFQAVVSQKDITSNDTVSSPKLLEPKINVLRY